MATPPLLSIRPVPMPRALPSPIIVSQSPAARIQLAIVAAALPLLLLSPAEPVPVLPTLLQPLQSPPPSQTLYLRPPPKPDDPHPTSGEDFFYLPGEGSASTTTAARSRFCPGLVPLPNSVPLLLPLPLPGLPQFSAVAPPTPTAPAAPVPWIPPLPVIDGQPPNAQDQPAIAATPVVPQGTSNAAAKPMTPTSPAPLIQRQVATFDSAMDTVLNAIADACTSLRGHMWRIREVFQVF
ncbi:hypothetical protein AX14_005696 [Amanita brunnescens Koide BX004]|nr:hypothetical protein AX14_005696 [Amanita brunnescens Koide BX004]